MFEIQLRCNKCLVIIDDWRPDICYKCGQTEKDFTKVKIKWEKIETPWWDIAHWCIPKLKRKVIEVIK